MTDIPSIAPADEEEGPEIEFQRIVDTRDGLLLTAHLLTHHLLAEATAFVKDPGTEHAMMLRDMAETISIALGSAADLEETYFEKEEEADVSNTEES